MHFRACSVFLFFVVGLSLAATHCAADVLYSSLGPVYNLSGTDTIGTAADAELGISPPPRYASQAFESSGNFAITNITVGVLYPPSQPGFSSSGGPSAVFSPEYDLWLYSDYEYPGSNDHIYGDPITELAQNLISPTGPALVSVDTVSSGATISADTAYWIVLTPANPYINVTWGAEDTLAGPEALEIDGTLITPEPATVGLLLLGLCAFVKNKSFRSISRKPALLSTGLTLN